MNNIDRFLLTMTFMALYYIPFKIYSISCLEKLTEKYEGKLPQSLHLDLMFGMVLALGILMYSFIHFSTKLVEKGWITLPQLSFSIVDFGMIISLMLGSLFFFGILPAKYGRKRAEYILRGTP